MHTLFCILFYAYFMRTFDDIKLYFFDYITCYTWFLVTALRQKLDQAVSHMIIAFSRVRTQFAHLGRTQGHFVLLSRQTEPRPSFHNNIVQTGLAALQGGHRGPCLGEH